ncbi:sugar-binding protein [Saccharibacillus deserti]|uniref:sugar-binding protein n=1 Tax=Saccharibacillus deserti TaxID=1634444 RepID=UPI0015580327|nr:sugar-binding protein [Saccharibacillus deserti]
MSIKKNFVCLLTASVLVLPVSTSGSVFAAEEQKASAKVVSIGDYGAVPDDNTDDLDSIRQAVAAAKAAGKSVYVPPGTFLYSDVIVLDGVDLAGKGESSILRSTNPNRQAVQLAGSGSSLRKVALTTVPVTTRLSSSISARVHVLPEASGFAVTDTTIDGGSSAGIIVYGKKGGIERNTIRNTLADGIHITGGSADIRVEDNTVRDTGDDMIAVVSYEKNNAWVSGVKIEDNDVSGGHARGITVSGGTDVTIEKNKIAYTGGAGIFIASEGSYRTYEVRNLKVSKNEIVGDSRNPSIPEKGGIRLQATNKEPSIVNASFEKNTIRDSADSGILILGSTRIEASFEKNRIVNPVNHGIHILRTTVGALLFEKNKVENAGGSPMYNQSRAEVVSDLPNSAPPGGGEEDTYTAARGTPVIDGSVDDVWINSTPLQLNRDPNGTAGTARIAWDNGALYYLFEMSDATPNALGSEENNDSVEVWVDERNAKNGTRTEGDYQLRVGLDGSLSSAIRGFDLSKVKKAVVKREGGYTVELAVPYTALTPKVGDIIGFNASANDDSNGDGKRDTYLSWVDKNLPYWADTRVYGEVKLAD